MFHSTRSSLVFVIVLIVLFCAKELFEMSYGVFECVSWTLNLKRNPIRAISFASSSVDSKWCFLREIIKSITLGGKGFCNR